MTLRSKLLLLLFALFAGLGSTQWFLLRGLTRELHDEAGAAAFEVGSQVASALGYSVPVVKARAGVPAAKIRRSDEALILSTTESSDGDVTVAMRLGRGEDVEQAHAGSVPMLPLEPAVPALQVVEQPIPIPRQGFNAAFERYRSSLTLGFLSLLGLGLVAAGWMTLRVSAPLRDLVDAARRIGDGELGVQIPTTGSVEIAQAARAFNRMSSELVEYERLARAHHEREHLGEISEMARALAHALRNPLNALGLTLEEHEKQLAQRGESWEEAGTARAQIRRIESSVRSLLSITGGEGTSCTPVRLGSLARDVALEVMQDIGGGLEFDVRDAPDLGEVSAVQPELRAVLQTLLVNAAEATSEGGLIEVVLGSSGDGEWTVDVLDRGTGLEPHIEGELFKPHATTKRSGTGMGLFLARRIVESRYGGSLDLTAREDGGVCARLVLHARVVEAGEARA